MNELVKELIARFPSRDSQLWNWGMVTGLIMYLLSAPPPTQWTYYQWLQFAGATIAALSGKGSWSPVPLKEK